MDDFISQADGQKGKRSALADLLSTEDGVQRTIFIMAKRIKDLEARVTILENK